jgi:hypothetical protein
MTDFRMIDRSCNRQARHVNIQEHFAINRERFITRVYLCEINCCAISPT